MDGNPSMTSYDPPSLGTPVGPYSHVRSIPLQDMILVSIAGQAGVDDQNTVVASDMYGQARQTFANISTALNAVGASWKHVLRTTTYITDRQDAAELNRYRSMHFDEFFGKDNYPTNTLIVVNGLLLPELLIEVEALAVVPERRDGKL